MTFGELIKKVRTENSLNLRELSAMTDIDQTLLSRIEKGHRDPTEAQVIALSEALRLNTLDLKKEWLADKVFKLIRYSPVAYEVLEAAESRIEYLSVSSHLKSVPVSDEIQKQLDQIDVLKKRWQSALPLNDLQKKRMEEYFDVAYTYESNRIEGNTLTLQETKLVSVDGLTIGGKSVVEHIEAVNHMEAIGFIRQLASNKEPISRRVILELHRLILKEVDGDHAGVYRQVPVMISGSKHEPPQPYLLDKLMEDFFEFYAYQESRLHPVILAAEMHERLVSIHPFIDGNGRTARLLMNLILSRNGYTRANIKGDQNSRLAYYKALETVQLDNERGMFYQLVLSEVRRSLEEHLKLV